MTSTKTFKIFLNESPSKVTNKKVKLESTENFLGRGQKITKVDEGISGKKHSQRNKSNKTS